MSDDESFVCNLCLKLRHLQGFSKTHDAVFFSFYQNNKKLRSRSFSFNALLLISFNIYKFDSTQFAEATSIEVRECVVGRKVFAGWANDKFYSFTSELSPFLRTVKKNEKMACITTTTTTITTSTIQQLQHQEVNFLYNVTLSLLEIPANRLAERKRGTLAHRAPRQDWSTCRHDPSDDVICKLASSIYSSLCSFSKLLLARGLLLIIIIIIIFKPIIGRQLTLHKEALREMDKPASRNHAVLAACLVIKPPFLRFVTRSPGSQWEPSASQHV